MKDEKRHGIAIRCYHLETIRFDPWTVCFPHTKGHSNGQWNTVDCVGSSGHASAVMGKHLGKRIPFDQLPEHIQRTVDADCRAYAGIGDE